MSELKKPSKKFMEQLCYDIDNDGLDYLMDNCDLDHFKGTALLPLVKEYKKAQNKLSAAIEKLRDEYEIEES